LLPPPLDCRLTIAFRRSKTKSSKVEINAEAQAANNLGVGNHIILGQELRSQERLSQNDVAIPARLEELAELEETRLAEKEDDDIQ
jgi:hypothetical protein